MKPQQSKSAESNPVYFELFQHLHEQHDLILLDSEMQEIIRICEKYQPKNIQSPDADNTERGERPSIKDYFPESFGVMDILPIYESQPELFNYAKALDRYIDDIENPTPPTLLNELRENADTDSAILDALSTILQVGASMATNGISDEISEWDLPKTTPIKAKRKIVKEAEKWNDVNRKRAIELKNAYDVLSRSYHNRPL